jgi:hypothetical protein
MQLLSKHYCCIQNSLATLVIVRQDGYGVGARHTKTQVPAAATQATPPTESKQAHRAGGKAATAAHAPPAAAASVQRVAAQVTHGPQPITELSAFGSLYAMRSSMATIAISLTLAFGSLAFFAACLSTNDIHMFLTDDNDILLID